MKLIVGLGNPGDKYVNTRHNIGFKVIDALCTRYNVKLNKEKFNGLFYKGEEFILAKPTTFMNLSGEFVQKISKFFKIETDDILVIYDDIDMETGKVRFRKSGRSGGQNGIKNIIEKMGTNDIPRLKIGIGRPKNSATNHVLGPFTQLQLNALNASKNKIIEEVETFINKK